MNKENCALNLVDEIILYYDARSKKTSNSHFLLNFVPIALRLIKNVNIIFKFIIPVVFYANEGGWVRQNTTV